jgi:putative endonuclease
MMYYVYILYSEDSDRYYIGHSNDPWNRLNQHLENEGKTYTGKHSNWKLKAVFAVSEKRQDALKMERFIKSQKSRKFIEKLLDEAFIPEGKIAQLLRVPHLRD